MSILLRLEKIHFIVKELELSLYLAQRSHNDFMSRTIARHILIRAENFIEHTRQLKKPLSHASFSVTEFHKQKEIYAKYFEEYFEVSRNKLGGHVQDLDFGKRLELWNDIEISKLSFFVDAAKDIYINVLGAMSIPGFIPYARSGDIDSEDLQNILENHKNLKSKQQHAEIASDPLALSRPNSGASLNFTPVHTRASQISLIIRWVKLHEEIRNITKPYTDVQRILKVRLVTDIVSMCDCLITRKLTPGSPQELEGLDEILKGLNEDNSAITNLISKTHFLDNFKPLRSLRDQIGTHLEIELSTNMNDLLSSLDSTTFSDISSKFKILSDVFRSQCHMVPFLMMHAADGEPLYGVAISDNQSSIRPFDENNKKDHTTELKAPDWNCEDTYNKNVDLWINGNKHDRGVSRYYFYEALQHSEIIEKIQEKESFGESSYSVYHHHFRKAHQFILDRIISESDEAIIADLAELLLQCKNGCPYPITEVFLRLGNLTIPKIQIDGICIALGAVASWPHKKVEDFLVEKSRSSNWLIKYHSILSLFRITLKSEGLKRVNNDHINKIYSHYIKPDISSLSRNFQLVLTASMASQFCCPDLSYCATEYQNEYINLQKSLLKITKKSINQKVFRKNENNFRILIRNHDYSGFSLLFSDICASLNDQKISDIILTCACNRWIMNHYSDNSVRHLACCMLRKKLFKESLEIVDNLITKNPTEIQFFILKAQILFETPNKAKEAKMFIESIRNNFALDKNQNDILNGIEAEILFKLASKP